MGKLTNVIVDFISLVNLPANKKPILVKSCNKVKIVPIKKQDNLKNMVYGVVYSPDEIDTQGDYATAEEIEKMAFNFMKNRKTTNVDVNHDFSTPAGFVAETWIKKDVDAIFPEEKQGAWIVGIKIEDEETWRKVLRGELQGISLAGFVEMETQKTESMEPVTGKTILEKLREIFGYVGYTENVEKGKEQEKINELCNVISELIKENQNSAKELTNITHTIEVMQKQLDDLKQNAAVNISKSKQSSIWGIH